MLCGERQAESQHRYLSIHTRIRHHCPLASRELVAASIGVFHHAAAAVTV